MEFVAKGYAIHPRQVNIREKDVAYSRFLVPFEQAVDSLSQLSGVQLVDAARVNPGILDSAGTCSKDSGIISVHLLDHALDLSPSGLSLIAEIFSLEILESDLFAVWSDPRMRENDIPWERSVRWHIMEAEVADAEEAHCRGSQEWTYIDRSLRKVKSQPTLV